ncbi:MAG: 26S proteasome non-ATPase regulatory subunit 9 [Marteilia pararefringens]
MENRIYDHNLTIKREKYEKNMLRIDHETLYYNDDYLSNYRNNNIGLDKKLVDDEGYPLADIDIRAVSQARQTVHMLKNDLKDIIKEISINIAKLHQSYSTQTDSTPQETMSSFDAGDILASGEEIINLTSENNYTSVNSSRFNPDNIPILKVTGVESETPASNAGLQEGDKIITFAQFDVLTFSSIDQIRTFLSNSSQDNINCKVARNEEILEVTIVRTALNQSLGMTIEPYIN